MLILLLTVGLLAPTGWAEKLKLTKAEALTLIARYKANPLSQDGQDISKGLVVWITETNDVTITLSAETCPFINEKTSKEDGGALLGAYSIGNAEAQLQSGKVSNHSYEGVLMMLQVYELLKQREPKFRSPSLENYAKQEAQGRLKARMDKITRSAQLQVA